MLELVKRLIEQAETRETFFRRIASFLAPMDERYKAIERAYDYAEEAFQNIEREGGERYFEHLRATAIVVIDYLRVTDPDIIIAALLHDIVEDIPSWTIARVRLEFGDKVALLIDYLSKTSDDGEISPEQRENIYHNRFRMAPREFFFVKLADRLHNLLTMWNLTPEKRMRKIEETKRHYLPYAEEQIILVHELETAIYELEQTKT